MNKLYENKFHQKYLLYIYKYTKLSFKPMHFCLQKRKKTRKIILRKFPKALFRPVATDIEVEYTLLPISIR